MPWPSTTPTTRSFLLMLTSISLSKLYPVLYPNQIWSSVTDMPALCNTHSIVNIMNRQGNLPGNQRGIQNAAARLIFNETKRTHVTPLLINLHWLPIAARIKFKALMFAYRTTSGSAPLYLNSLLQTYMPSRSLHSANERRITVPSQRGTKSLSLTFSLTVPIWWYDLPNSIRAAESLPIFKKRLKTHLFHLYLTL